MKSHASLAALLLAAGTINGEASMNGQTISGDILDPRITACGVRIEEGGMAAVRPFIETSADLSGRVRINVTKKSRSGTSMSSQGNAFSGGSLGNLVLAVDTPSTVRIEMTVTANDGSTLCSLDDEIELGAPAIRL